MAIERDDIDRVVFSSTAPGVELRFRRVTGLESPRGFNGAVLVHPTRANEWLLVYRRGHGGDRPLAVARLDGATLRVVRETAWELPGEYDARLLRDPGSSRVFMTTTQRVESPPHDYMKLRVLEGFEEELPHCRTEVHAFERIADWPGYAKRGFEKNWIVFFAEGGLRLVHSIRPFRVLAFDPDYGVSLRHTHPWSLPAWWEPIWGTDLRGTTPPVSVAAPACGGEALLCTWHTFSPAAGGYFTGFYAFEPPPPHRPLALGGPLFGPDECVGEHPHNKRKRKVVFLVSLLLNDAGDRLTLTGGNADSAQIVVDLALADALDSLRPI